MILVDTSILSLAFRRRRRDLNPVERAAVYRLEELFAKGEVVIIGPIRQEVLSGIKIRSHFEQLRERMSVLNDLPMDPELFERAAEFHNTCRSAGVAPGDIDMMIAAAAFSYDVPIFTADPDFKRYAAHLPISLHP